MWQEVDPDLYDGIFETEEDQERDEMDTEDQPQISHETNENISADCHESDPGERHISTTNAEEEEDMIAMEENCKPYDTCLSKLPEEANQIFSIAPGEGSKPIPLLTDKLFEELLNPDTFPSGKGGYASTQRDTRLTLWKYVNSHLLDQNGCFARDIEYIFGMQYAVEHKQVRVTINIALRQTRGRQQLG